MTNVFDLLPEKFIIFDTEYTAWEGSQKRGWSGENEYMELVQIGALKVVKTPKTIKIVKKLNIYIKPKKNPELSEYFTNLTGITQNTLDKKGVTFNEAMKQFYNFCKTKNNVKLPMFSYGNDYDIIKYNLKLNSINKKSRFYKWEKKFYDIRPIFDCYVDTSKYTSGTIYKAFDIDSKNANVHNALWDCKSIFYSLKHIIS